jgi:hypothetical protein
VTEQDRHILQLRFSRGLTVAKIARAMGLEQKALYGRCERLLAALRARLEGDGVVASEVLPAIGGAADHAPRVLGPRRVERKPKAIAAAIDRSARAIAV